MMRALPLSEVKRLLLDRRHGGQRPRSPAEIARCDEIEVLGGEDEMSEIAGARRGARVED